MTHIRIRASLGGNIPGRVENPAAPHHAIVLEMGKIGQFCGKSLTADYTGVCRCAASPLTLPVPAASWL